MVDNKFILCDNILMMMIHTHNVPKSRKRKPTKADIARLAEYNKWRKTVGLEVVESLKCKTYKAKRFETYVVPTNYRQNTTTHIPSLNTDVCDTSRKEVPKYTGENLLGIAVMHKSNLVPVFKKEQAIEISRMRRG
jgi:hypothetical protein